MDTGFLPISLEECRQRGIKQLDFVYVIGDAYVDHPSFGPAIISRVLESQGYQVGILSQPDMGNPESIQALGEPRLAFLVSAGNMDSMVNHYSVSRKRRQTDAYTPGGLMGKRPDRASISYCNFIRRAYKKVPIILGGIEASLRRLAHYDYWSNSLKRSLLLDSGADLISYGMGERSIVEIAHALHSGLSVKDITFIQGTVYKTSSLEGIYDRICLPDYETLLQDKSAYARSFHLQHENTDPFSGKRLVEAYSSHCFVVQNPPALPLTTEEMDRVYALPYTRRAHPSYDALGGVPATKEIQFSLVSSRGCFGGCSFCALTFHQGRIVQVRSQESLLEEARKMTQEADFKGYIHDVGGPTANFRHPACKKQETKGACKNRQCLFPTPCKNLDVSHKDYRMLLKRLREIPGVKKVFIRSGIRFDYLLAENQPEFLEELCGYHVSGQLKVAPEHISDAVLKLMGKPSWQVYKDFCRAYEKTNQRLGKKQFLVPYLMSSHPGSTLKEAVKLGEYCRDLGYMPEQVQDFYPTPSTISTCMYYTGLDPRTMEKVYVPDNPHEKAMQRALIQYRDPKNYQLVLEALEKAGRLDLVGYEKHCLIRPPAGKPYKESHDTRNRKGCQKKKTIRNIHKKKVT
ncbi:MAG: YgiQ family radical SAM protein [Lachnospiraceae bacterium]|nr:YgiQ family radical SAM protein [Lachnospiraceae bacterium]